MRKESSYLLGRVAFPDPLASVIGETVDAIRSEYNPNDVETAEACFYSYFLWCENTDWHTDPVDQLNSTNEFSDYFKTQLIVLEASSNHVFKDFEGNAIPLSVGDILVFDATKEHCLEGSGLFYCLAQDLFDEDALFTGDDWLEFLPDCL